MNTTEKLDTLVGAIVKAMRPVLIVRCAWCDPRKDEPNVSHGICPACAIRLKAKLMGSVGKGGGK